MPSQHCYTDGVFPNIGIQFHLKKYERDFYPEKIKKSLNQGKKSKIVKKLAEKQRANKARREGNLEGLLQGPKIADLVEKCDEANKENIPPKLPFQCQRKLKRVM